MYEALPGQDDSYRLVGEVKALAALKRTAEARAVQRRLEANWGEFYYVIGEGYLALGTAIASGPTAIGRWRIASTPSPR